MIFCTLFDRAYLPHGLSLYQSLDRACKGRFVLHVLCMDDFTAGVLRELELPRLRVVELTDIEDEALRAARSDRSVGEFCWTCTSPLLLHVLDGVEPGEIVAYVDADIRFFSDPSVVHVELGGGSIFVHEHGFAPEHAHLLREAGRFNVGLVAFRNNEEGRACLERWKAQCLAECRFDPAAGKCGDQNYLDEWPARYRGLVISANPGVGLAPWNITKLRLGQRRGMLTVDDRPLVFYHYHSLKMLRPRWGLTPIAMVIGAYRLSEEVISWLYAPYAKELWQALRRAETSSQARNLHRRLAEELAPLELLYPQLDGGQLLVLFCGMRMRRTRRLVRLAYGI
jgi:hypothetical protein